MRTTIGLLVVLALGGACAPGPDAIAPPASALVPITPVTGEAISYVQRFEISERTSEGEGLPSITIEQRVELTCESADGERSRMKLSYGDASVWIEGATGDATFVATDAGAIARVYDEEEIDASRAYAALWGAMGHLVLEGSMDHRGFLHDVSGLDEVTRRRDGDIATDLGGSMLESLIADPALLSLQTSDAGKNRIGFRLAQWRALLYISATIEERDGGDYVLSYESDSGEAKDGPFATLSLSITGSGSRLPETGLPSERTLSVTVSGDVPVDDKGTLRQDSARIRYTLSRADS